jgi:MucB/RseB N-terminal domain/Putative zinc-finger
VSRRPCADLAESRSAYVDDALGPDDRERLLAHLAGCAACRSDVDELRTIRRLLNGSGTQATASVDLSQRLTSIAGSQASDPLWSRPFRRTSPGMLPSERRMRRLRLGAAGLAVGAVVSTAVGVGYAAAPSPALAVIDDPSSDAQAEFSSMLAQSPLVTESFGAVMLAGAERLTSASGLPPASIGQHARRESSLTSVEARGALVRASAATSRFSYSGTQAFTALLNGTTVNAVIQIDSRKQQGSQLTVLNERGDKILAGYARPAVKSRMVDNQLLDLLERNYRVSGWSGTRIAGRAATVVEASTRGTLAARWWIDDATGLLLGQETYDAQGQVTLSSRFTSLRIGSASSILEHLPPRLAVSTTTSALTLSSSPQLTARGWSCSHSLAGLALVRVRTDRADSPNVLHLVYSDGLNTVSVVQRRGLLGGPPPGAWNPDLGAYLGRGTLGLATWQSGATVYTVITDGPTQLLADSVRGLPHEPLSSPTTMERVQAGWADILSRLRR